MIQSIVGIMCWVGDWFRPPCLVEHLCRRYPRFDHWYWKDDADG